MYKDILVTINLLPHVLLLKNKNTGNKTGVICWFFQERNCKYPSCHKTAGTCVRIVMESIFQRIVLRKTIQKKTS